MRLAPLLPTSVIYFGVFAIVTSAFGLFAGMSVMNRRFLVPSLIAAGLLMICGILILIPINNETMWTVGLPTTLLSIPSFILTFKSKKEFR